MTATASPIEIPVNPLSRDLDVTVTITRPQTEVASDLSLLCYATPDVNLPPNNDRVRLYYSFDALTQDTGWTSADTGWWAGKAFFDQTDRPPKMAVGRVCENPVSAQLMAAVITQYDALSSVVDGAFSVDVIDIQGTPAAINVEGINFTGAATLAAITASLNTAIADSGAGSLIAASIEYGGKLVLTASGGHTTISYASGGVTGTDVSTMLCLTQEAGAQKWDAYTPTGLVGEIQNIAAAARVGGFPVFAWALDKKYRDTPQQKEVSDWAETQNWKAWALQCTNSPNAYNSGDTTNITFYAYNMGYRATSVVYHDNSQQYPEIAFTTAVLNTNYGLRDSVITACFKDGAGISPCNITETQLTILTSRRCNVFVRVGNTARTYRYGMQSSPTWWTDSFAGACNFREELQVSVCNALYRNKKLPYTTRGQAVIISAIAVICDRYVYNGYLADRDVLDLTNENGYSTLSAYRIDPTPIYRATDTERANRILPPIRVVIYEAGAIHHVDIAVDLIN